MGGYQIIKQLGQGAMGAVYLAARVRDDAKVAIKVMLASVAIDDHARKLFQREIEVIRNLRHPNIVELFDHGPVSGGFYFAMELCPGGSVGSWIERLGRPLTVAEVGPIALAAAAGLAYAHEQGFVHRDIKPDNLLMTEPTGGVIKVADFGLAKSFDKAGLSGMTATNAVGGTPLFMAREQIINYKLVKPPTDVWSLAATFYWMLSRQPTRDFRRDMDPLLTILTDPVVPLRKRAPAVPQRLAEVIDRALADEVAQRFPTMSAFRSALEAAL
jgi:serine/threonine-protein kinase